MKKTQVDLENAVVHIADSKTANGIGDVPMTAEAREAFRRQIEETPGSESEIERQQAVHHQRAKGMGGRAEESWCSVLCSLRVAAQFRRPVERRRRCRSYGDPGAPQGDAEVFKAYSQAKLGMMREALGKLDRLANERSGNLFTERPHGPGPQ